MNQTFKKKAIAASLAAAFVVVGAGFVAVPGIAPISAAQANQFADTTQVAGVTAGVNVPVSTSAGVTFSGQSFVITENVGAAITAGADIVLTLSNGAKWVGATATPTASTGVGINGNAKGTAMSVNASNGLVIDSASAANLQVPISTASSAGTGSTITISGMTIDTSAMTVGQTVSVSISSTSTATGLTTGVSTLLGTVAAPGVTVTADATTVPTYPKSGSTSIVNTITVAEVIQGSVKDMSSATDEITVTLPSGYTFLTPGTTASTDDFTTDNGTATANVAKYNVSGAATTASGKKVILGNPTVFIPSSAADGNVDATVAVKLSDGTTKTTTVTLFKVTAGATSDLAYQTGTTTAPTTYAALYAGRVTQDTTLDVAVKEVVGSTLLGGGTVSLTLPTGVTTGKTYAITTDVAADGTGVPAITAALTAADGTAAASGQSSIMATLAADTTATAGKVTFKVNSLNLDDTVPVGDLSVTVGGSANVTAGTVKVATVIHATDASVSGATSTVTAGSVLSLPDVVITENKAGALTTTATGIGMYIANANGVNLTTTNATVKAYKADGTDVSSTIFGASSGATITTGAAGLLTFPVSAQSSSNTGPVTIKISGVKATLLSTAAAGDVTAVVGGVSATTDTTPTSSEGALAYKSTVTVGKIVSAVVPSIPTATATGTVSSQTIVGSLVPAGNDQGKLGSVFVAAVAPASMGGGIFGMTSTGSWGVWNGQNASFPVYSTGALATVPTITFANGMNVTGAIGAAIYVGYGIGGPLSPAGTAFANMLSNGTYNLSYTIK